MYLNALQAHYFETGELNRQHALVNPGPGLVIKCEVEALVGYSVAPAEDVIRQFGKYMTDDSSKTMRRAGVAPERRAFTMTLLDMLHDPLLQA